MSQWSTLTVQVEPPVAFIRLNRPNARNAITLPLLDELVSAAETIQSNEAIRIVVLQGEGKSFSVGFDLTTMAGVFSDGLPAEDVLLDMASKGRAALDAIAGLSAVTVASIQGHAIGGGFLLAAACDVRVAAHGTRFGLPEIDLGLPLTWGGVPLLCRQLGPSLAKDLVLTGRRFGTEDVNGIGYFHRVVEPEDLATTTAEVVEQLRSKPALALSQIKAQFQQAMGVRDDGVSDEERFVQALKDPNFLANAMAYVQGLRKPR